MKSEKSEQWNIKLRVTSTERRKIQKEAIDLDLRVGEYIKLRLLGSLSIQEKTTIQKKSA